MSLSGSFALRYPPLIPCVLPRFVSPLILQDSLTAGSRLVSAGGLSFTERLPYHRLYRKETPGSPKFPSYPFRYMPWSQTPVVTPTLALTCSGLLPSACSTASAFFPLDGSYPMTTTIHFSGLNTEPVPSIPPASYSGCPVCTWISLLSWWLAFAQVELDFG